MKRSIILHLFAALCLLAAAPYQVSAHEGLKNATVLLIRHADKPDAGDGLSPAGEARAQAYVAYFEDFKFDGKPVKVEAIYAAADSKSSHRPRLTVEPLARALGLSIDTRFRDDDYPSLVNALHAHREGKNVLVCWHHGKIPELLRALGTNPDALLPDGKWSSDVYNWVIILRYDANGNLAASQRVVEPF